METSCKTYVMSGEITELKKERNIINNFTLGFTLYFIFVCIVCF